ncbi:c-type cytochrome biogenesis protein CcmI [Aliiglaciecola litoralis]|uniref:C-type cytochrome biogenesis protein CcmI n=1 Tax=Aliiglaciecola litoralis TaxID=582857 RepID=A0ABN1LGZ7_9ALTE
MSSYWLGVALLSLLAIGIIVLPWIRKGDRATQDILTNTRIIKQRMQELDREVSEGLVSAEDKQSAINELKLALVDESTETNTKTGSATGVLVIGLTIGVGLCGYLYWQSNEVSDIRHWQNVTQQSSALAKRIVVEADPTITGEDVQDFALAMRTKLINTPDDHIGWLLLGRLQASLNRIDEALHAFAKAYELAPNHAGILSSYSQTLVRTGQEEYLRRAQGLIKRAIELNPEDINAYGMLAVASGTLGDTQEAIASWQKLKDKLPASDPMRAEVDKRIAELRGESLPSAKTAITVTVDIAQNLIEKLPKTGYLFVFAQDAQGQVRMPAAVVKMPLVQLPVTIELSDANAMMPTYTLSQLTQVKLVARVSVDENVAQAQGELQGDVIIDLETGSQVQQQITIDKELQ